MQADSLSGRVRAYNYIRDEVLPDPAAHGTFITEDQVASRIGGLSRTPVREAFLLLGAEGLLELVPRHGAFVPPVRRQEIDEALELRRLIERRALEVVLSSRRVPLAAMKEALALQEAACAEGAEREFNIRDTEFHMALIRAAGNSLMTKAYSDLRTRQIRMGVLLVLAEPQRRRQVVQEHRAIIAALEAQDLEQAIFALNRHIDETHSGLKEL